MTEEQEQPTQNGLKFETLKYLGKELVKQGKKPDGSDWALFKVKFEYGQFGRTFKVFHPMTEKSALKLKDLVEGNVYYVGFAEEPYQHPQYGLQNTRRAVIFRLGDPNQITPVQAAIQPGQVPATGQQPQKMQEIEKKFIEEFVLLYKISTPPERWHHSHFIGAYILHRGLLPDLTDELEKGFDTLTQ